MAPAATTTGSAASVGGRLPFLNSARMSYVCGEVLWTDGGFNGALTTGRTIGFDAPAE